VRNPPDTDAWTVHQAGRDLLSAAVTITIAATALALLGWTTTVLLVLGLAAVLAATGAALLAARPPVGQCTRGWSDQGHGAPWGRCTLRRGHQGTCVP
jgi:hypothetical protein